MSATRLPLRRSLAATLAAVIASSVLLLVGVTTAGAANTAKEEGLDGTTRTLSGASRYATGVALATNAIDNGQAQAEEGVILVSGVSLVDALGAVPLAAANGSVVLLTPTDGLTRDLRDFMNDRETYSVTIVGGTEAVSEDVEDELLNLNWMEEVNRVSGADRYVTAVETAIEAGEAGFYCGSESPAVFLVNGESLIDGVMAAPAAYSMRMPVLFTRTNSLPDEVGDYLIDQEVGLAVVVGSEDEVSEGVLDELDGLGVVAERIDGENASARSVALAQSLSAANDCAEFGDGSTLAANNFAILDADTPIDGVTAAAALAYGLGDNPDQLVPVLATDEGEISTEVAEHLASIPTLVGPNLQNVQLYALGGTARITPEMMTAALEAATTSDPLEATIAATPGSRFVKVSFSDAVSAAAQVAENYTIAGSPLFLQDVICNSTSDRTAGMPCAAPGRLGPNEIAIVLSGYTLGEGDVIDIAGAKIMGAQPGGARNDNRVLAATSFTVPAPIDDRNEPGVSVLAPAGANFVRVVVDEENTIANPLSEDEVWITVGNTVYTGAAAASRTDADGNAFTSQRVWVFPSADNKRFDIGWNCADGADAEDDVDGDIAASGLIEECDQTNVLAVDSSVEVFENAIADGSGNASPRRRSLVVVVAANNDEFATQGSATLTAPAVHVEPVNEVAQPQNAEIEVVQRLADNTETVAFKLTARTDGPNAGAAGNGWRFGVNRVADDDDEVSPVGIDINDRRRSIGVSYDDETTLYGLLQALQANETIAESFEVAIEGDWPDAAYTEAIAATTTLFPRSDGNNPSADFPTEIVTAGGRTSVKLALTFEEVIKEFDIDTFADGNFGTAFGPRAVADGNLSTGVKKSPEDGPTRTVTLTYIYSVAGNVPSGRLTVDVAAGTATNYSNVGNVADLGVRVAEAR